MLFKEKNEESQSIYPLHTLYLYISGACNLSCKHCWIDPCFDEHANKNNKYLSLNKIKSALDESKPLGLKSIKLTGGEPFLHPEIDDIIQLINKYKLKLSIETNGTLITEERATLLAELDNKPFIAISLDGSTPTTNDFLRGIQGAFDRTITGISNLVSKGFHPQIICTLHKKNIHEIESIVELAKTIGCGSIKFNNIQKVGRGESMHEKIGLSITELINIYDKKIKSLEDHFGIQVFFDIPVAFFPIKRLISESSSHCNIKSILGVLSNGSISICGIGVIVPELILGTIGETPIKNIWLNHPILETIRKDLPDKIQGICSNCIHRNLCLGACIAQNYFKTGNLLSSYSFCENANQIGLFPQTRKIT